MSPNRNTLTSLLLLAMVGCHSLPAVPATTLPSLNAYTRIGLTTPSPDDLLDAYAVPPIGWTPDPLKGTDKHAHQAWLSPTRNTAYGIIRFKLPLPVGHDWALWGFINEMKRSEGEALLISKSYDEKADGLRFVVEGGQYRVRCLMRVHGFSGWAVYAGTLRKNPVDDGELLLAERARENTKVELSPQDKGETSTTKPTTTMPSTSPTK